MYVGLNLLKVCSLFFYVIILSVMTVGQVHYGCGVRASIFKRPTGKALMAVFDWTFTLGWHSFTLSAHDTELFVISIRN
jgi:hypothetical protein